MFVDFEQFWAKELNGGYRCIALFAEMGARTDHLSHLWHLRC